jgi:hypothetical protein
MQILQNLYMMNTSPTEARYDIWGGLLSGPGIMLILEVCKGAGKKKICCKWAMVQIQPEQQGKALAHWQPFLHASNAPGA